MASAWRDMAGMAGDAEGAPAKPMVPSGKVMLLGSIGLIIMMSLGGFLGFSEMTAVMQQKMDTASAHESGWVEPQAGEDGMVSCSVGIDMGRGYNSTHGIVYWYLNVKVPLYSNVVVVLENLRNAEVVELRIFEWLNKSNWEPDLDHDIEKYLWEIEYYSFDNHTYIHRIGAVAQEPGGTEQWLVYSWQARTQTFEYVVQSSAKFQPSNNDLLVIAFGELGVEPIDHSGGQTFRYKAYDGPA